MAQNLLTCEKLVLGLRLGAVGLSAIYYGACQYITSVEVPARSNLPTPIHMVENFQQTFPRAKAFQGGIALICGLGNVAQYFLDRENPTAPLFLSAGLILLAIWPYTIAIIMPINNQLMAGEEPKKKSGSWIKEMMDSWGQVHLVRTIGGAIAFGLCARGLMMLGKQ